MARHIGDDHGRRIEVVTHWTMKRERLVDAKQVDSAAVQRSEVLAGSSRIACRRCEPIGFCTKSLPHGLRHGMAQKRIEHKQTASTSTPVVSTTTKEVVKNVMIGIDHHMASHTAVAIDGSAAVAHAAPCEA
jgi:hypothetical protein